MENSMSHRNSYHYNVRGLYFHSNMSLNFKTLLSLFDTYVRSIANYGCEVWGTHSAPDIEKVHMDFCKSILGVKCDDLL
jgi:uncharacterized protein YutD